MEKKWKVYACFHVDPKICEVTKRIIEDQTYYKPKVVCHGLDFAVYVVEYADKERSEKVLSDLKKIGIYGILV